MTIVYVVYYYCFHCLLLMFSLLFYRNFLNFVTEELIDPYR